MPSSSLRWAVEAFLNELESLDWWSSEEPSLLDLDDRLKALRRVLTLAEKHNVQGSGKLLLAHEILGRPLDAGQPPFQDYVLLKQLRDAIVHPKPTSIELIPGKREVRSSRYKILRALESRGLLPSDPSRTGLPFLVWLSDERIARWAVKAAATVVVATIEALPTGQFKVATTLLLRDFASSPLII